MNDRDVPAQELAPLSPEGHEAEELHETAIEDQLSAVVDHLGRVSMTENKQLQQEAVNRAMEVLDSDNLQKTVVDEETGELKVVSHFDMADVIPKVHKIDEEAAEEVIIDFATKEELLNDQNFTNQLVENVAEIMAGGPLMDEPKFKAEAIRGQAITKVNEIRSEAFENQQVDESSE